MSFINVYLTLSNGLIIFLPDGLTLTGNPFLSMATKEQVASNPIPLILLIEVPSITVYKKNIKYYLKI